MSETEQDRKFRLKVRWPKTNKHWLFSYHESRFPFSYQKFLWWVSVGPQLSSEERVECSLSDHNSRLPLSLSLSLMARPSTLVFFKTRGLNSLTSPRCWGQLALLLSSESVSNNFSPRQEAPAAAREPSASGSSPSMATLTCPPATCSETRSTPDPRGESSSTPSWRKANSFPW